jgi:hypothetical protein
VCLAGLIYGTDSPDGDLIWRATESRDAIVRVAAAFTLPMLPRAHATRIAMVLLSDRDAGVRARAVRFAAGSRVDALVHRVRDIADRDREQWVRDLAADLLDRRGGSQP